MNLKILILEDSAHRIGTFMAKLGDRHEVTCVDTAKAAIDLLREKEGYFDVLFLDHDLGGEPPYYYGVNCDISDENTGSEVVRWMLHAEGGVMNQPYVIIHSLNEPAARDMEHKLKHGDFDNVYRIPFTALVRGYLDDPSFLS